jgi:hypothetical protein
MFGRAKVLLTIAACVLALPVAAEAPAPTTAFDGQYVGTATLTGGGMAGATSGPMMCGTITSVYMTITGAQVFFHEIFFNGGRRTYRGGIDAAGLVSASHQSSSEFWTVSGIIDDKVFTGQRVIGYGHRCYFSIKMDKATGSTPLDGEYTGVSRESSKTASTSSAEFRRTPLQLL